MDMTSSNDFFPSAGVLDDSFAMDFGIDPTMTTSNNNFQPDFHSANATLPPSALDPNADLDSIFDTTVFDQSSSFASATANPSGDVWNTPDQSQQNFTNQQHTYHTPKSSSSDSSGDRDSSQSSNGDSPSTTSRTTRKRGRPTASQTEGNAAPVKKTRQRKKKKQPSKEEVENKRKKFLERNRLAASKCRSKRKDWTLALEQKNKELMVLHNQLVAEYEGLKTEIDCLKTQLMMHKSCNDGPVQKWLQMEAERAVENLRGSQPMSRTNSTGMDYSASRSSSLDYGARSPSLFSPTNRQYSMSAAGFRSGGGAAGALMRPPSAPSSQAMSRTGSGSSENSGAMSKRDSGVSDLDLPTPPNVKYELPPDEGYVTSPKPRMDNNTMDPRFVRFDLQQHYQMIAQFGPYLPQSMGLSPTDVINPAEFLAPEVL
ncbi:hypothetical protein B7463_g12008, partial [Scytalidium lignicola]